MIISIVGTGYVGLTTGALLAVAGNKVYCIDVIPEKITMIKAGKAPFFEPGLDHFIKEAIESGNLIPTLSYEESIPESEIALVSVGTPSNPDGSVNLQYIFEAVESIGKYMKDGLVVVQKSTVPVGTGRKLEEILQKTNKKFDVVSCPEFLAESSAVFDTLNMDRFVIGGDSEVAKAKVVELFKSLDELSKKTDLSKLSDFTETYRGKVKKFNQIPFEDRVVSMKLESSELVKVTSNAYLATKISFANSIARICDLADADINEVMEGVGRDDRIGRAFLYAGLGWGGGCFPKDTAGLLDFANKLGFKFDMLKGVIDVNFDQLNYVAEKAEKMLAGNITNKTISILGLSFKPGTSDSRTSPSIRLVKLLLEKGAILKLYDPESIDEAKKEMLKEGIEFDKLNFVSDLKSVFEDSELAILATEWPEFLNIDFGEIGKLMKTKNLLDARNKWDSKKAISYGFTYVGIGKK